MKCRLLLLIVLIPFFTVAQRPSETVKDKDLYGSETEWSCQDKHFGYYYINYSLPMPLIPSIENELKSGIFSAGYAYRYKIIPSLDIGAELSCVNRRSFLDKDSLLSFDPGTFYNNINTYHNSISGAAYIRINIGKSSYRNLGWFTDLGGLYSYAFNYGTNYVLKSSSLFQKAKFKKPYYLNPYNYGIFLRMGYNNLAVIFTYSLGKWITDYSAENKDYARSGLLVGIQMNLYAK
ncbi:MAG TPA: hypothetical protein PLL66_06665 [Bacteroidales bacterium]|nr:hypothetical protein [Bacteroidales bacterium]